MPHTVRASANHFQMRKRSRRADDDHVTRLNLVVLNTRRRTIVLQKHAHRGHRQRVIVQPGVLRKSKRLRRWPPKHLVQERRYETQAVDAFSTTALAGPPWSGLPATQRLLDALLYSVSNTGLYGVIP